MVTKPLVADAMTAEEGRDVEVGSVPVAERATPRKEEENICLQQELAKELPLCKTILNKL